MSIGCVAGNEIVNRTYRFIKTVDGGLAQLNDGLTRSAESNHSLTSYGEDGLIFRCSHHPGFAAGLEVVGVGLASGIAELRVQSCKQVFVLHSLIKKHRSEYFFAISVDVNT